MREMVSRIRRAKEHDENHFPVSPSIGLGLGRGGAVVHSQGRSAAPGRAIGETDARPDRAGVHSDDRRPYRGS